MNGDKATVLLRTHHGDQSYCHPRAVFQSAATVSRLWKKQPDADVAVMYAELPLALTTEHYDHCFDSNAWRSAMKRLRKSDIGPGVELKILGAFRWEVLAMMRRSPILRTGVIVSYPILPDSHYKEFSWLLSSLQGEQWRTRLFLTTKWSRVQPLFCCPPQFIPPGACLKRKSTWTCRIVNCSCRW